MVKGIIDVNNNEYLDINRNIPDGYAHAKIAFDNNGNPNDFIFLKVNDSFEKLTGVKKQQILGKRFTESLPDLMNDEFDYICEFGSVAVKGGNSTCEFYSQASGKWYSIFIFSEEYGYFSTIFRDITETKNLINELHRANYLNAILLDSIPHPALLVSKDRAVIAANKLAKDLGTIVGGYCWRDFGHGEYLSEDDKNYIESSNTYDNRVIACSFCEADEALRTNTPFNIEKKLGDAYWDIHWIPTQEEGIYLHYSIDITERKQNENNLQESELRFRQIAEASFEGICIHNEGIILDCNKRMEKVFGYRTDELIGMPLCNIITKGASQIVKEDNQLNEIISDKHFGIRKNGALFEIEILSRKMEYKGVKAEVLVIRDIAKTRSTEEMIRKINIALSDAQRIAHIGNIEVDICSEKIYCSDEVFRIFGYEPQAFTPDYGFFRKHFHEDDFELIKSKIIEGTPFESTFFIESKFSKLGESEGWLNIKGDIEFDSQNSKAIRIFLLVQDVTDKKQEECTRKKNEESIRLLQETLEMDRLKTEFFANVSHELRTPLNIIFSTLQLFELYIRNGLNDGIEDKILKGIKGMKQNSYRLLRLINNLIDVTKIDGDFISLQLENCDIVNVISKICLSVSEYMEGKNISFTFNTNIEGKTIACDLDKIETIILNLISNAIKFNKPGGKVTVNIQNDKDGILISIEDTGIGIPSEKKDKIFERFMQVDRSLTRTHEGSGIGLSLVKHFVEMHGGRIWVESEYGKGSKFIFKLPERILETKESNIINENPTKYHNDYVERISIEFSDIYT